MRLVLVAAAMLALSGCATPALYEWGGYEQFLYDSYKDPSKVEAMRVGIETQIASSAQSGQRVAPGLYAELGTLYLQAGSSDKAIEMYAKEREAWPESKGLMDAMIANLQSLNKATGREK